ncbi:Hypothetical predicted protein, partial [Pelobates cultripes]
PGWLLSINALNIQLTPSKDLITVTPTQKPTENWEQFLWKQEETMRKRGTGGNNDRYMVGLPILQPLWGYVKDILQALHIIDVPLNPSVYLFLLCPPALTKAHKQMIALTVLAARNLIAIG